MKFARLLTLVLSLTATALGEEAHGPLAGQGFTIDASGPCELGADFEARVAARLRGPVPGPTRVLVSSRTTEQGTLAVLHIEGAGGEVSSRELHARDCEEAISAMATVLSIALGALVEPDAAQRPTSASTPLESSSPPAASPSEPPRSISPEPSPRVERGPAAPPSPPWVLGLGAEGGLDFSLSPTFAYGGAVFGTARRGALGPSLRLHAGRFADPGARANGRGFAVALLFAEAQGCPFAFELLQRWWLEPCVAVGVGRYTAKGTTGLVRAVERSTIFTTPAILGRSRVSLGGTFGWELSAQLVFPLQSRMSLIANGEGGVPIPLFDVPEMSAAARTGLWVDFP